MYNLLTCYKIPFYYVYNLFCLPIQDLNYLRAEIFFHLDQDDFHLRRPMPGNNTI